MSADNFYVVRRDPAAGTFVVTMGFASDEVAPCKLGVEPGDQRYATESAAVGAALGDYSEYGVSTEHWCVGLDGHAPGCANTDWPHVDEFDDSFDDGFDDGFDEDADAEG